MTRIERIGDCTLYLGADQRVSAVPRRAPWGKTPIKEVVSCRACLWTWKPSTGFGHEHCPQCRKARWGTVSREQNKRHGEWGDAGSDVYVCRSLEDVEDVLRKAAA